MAVWREKMIKQEKRLADWTMEWKVRKKEGAVWPKKWVLFIR